jgi:hypothetical protein
MLMKKRYNYSLTYHISCKTKKASDALPLPSVYRFSLLLQEKQQRYTHSVPFASVLPPSISRPLKETCHGKLCEHEVAQ